MEIVENAIFLYSCARAGDNELLLNDDIALPSL